ncbi:MAG: acetyl-CoA carboxylase biotin carboxyl carrier protein [Bacteroidota bacterium]
MTCKEMLDLLKTINRLNLTEFKMKDGDFELTVRTKEYSKTRTITAAPTAPTIVPVPQAIPPVATSTTAAVETIPVLKKEESVPTPTAKEEEKHYLEVKSPIVGTFYRSSSPDKPAYAKVGDKIKSGDVVCIVEAMKLFNEIESEISGTVVKVMVEDAQPVEYDQVLFLLEA